MSGIRTISQKVMPIEVKPKENNFIDNKGSYIVKQFRFLISLQSLFCINRLYLLKVRRILVWLTYIYTIVMVIFLLYYIFTKEVTSASLRVVRNTAGIEFLLLVIFAISTKKAKLINFYEKLGSIDSTMNISNNTFINSTDYRSLWWLIGSILYNVTEFVLVKMFMTDLPLKGIFYYIMTIPHDSEQIFCFSMMRIIFIRLKIVKAHVIKLFCINEQITKKVKLDEVENLSDNVNLDVTSLHQVYELLNKSAEQLNSIMSFPMLVMLFSSGLSTTMLLKMLVTAIQATDLDPTKSSTTMIYVVARCFKYTLLVLIPCYYSSITAAQVGRIRTILHDTINSMPLDRTERRKVKALLQMTKVNEFSYVLCGVFSLNMSLPLSYMSLCTTYLVIIIQFSKFID